MKFSMMQLKKILSLMVFSLSIFSLSSCSIEGEEICGIWNATGEYGEMQLEITPWKGKFLAYLMSYKSGEETITGGKSEEHIFITDLVLQEGKYINGKIYLDPNTKDYCGLQLEFVNKNQLKAIYQCDGQTSEEFWFREGFLNENENENGKLEGKRAASLKIAEVGKKNSEELDKTKSTGSEESSRPIIEEDVKKQSSFYIVGIQSIVGYDDYSAIEKDLESMWTQAYENDFSPKLDNILEVNNMYVAYSNYDQPKGKMTITLGYKVGDLNSIPSKLSGLEIPSNEYLVYPMSGTKSDYEGEGWDQLNELMMYRKANSVDYEIYTFDNNYEVTNAVMWIATK